VDLPVAPVRKILVLVDMVCEVAEGVVDGFFVSCKCSSVSLLYANADYHIRKFLPIAIFLLMKPTD